MKRAIATLLLVALVGCTSTTGFGKCIGVSDKEDPKLEYKVSKWNAFLAIIFIETIIVPIWVLVDETKCPVGKAP